MIPPQIKAAWETGKTAILVAVAILLFAVGFAVGLRWAHAETEEAKRARDNQANAAAAWKDRAGALGLAVQEWERTYAQDEEARAAQRDQATRVLAKLEKERKAAEGRAEDWRRKYEAAKASPDCAELMKATKCPVFSSF